MLNRGEKEEEMDYDKEDQIIKEDEDVEGHGLAHAEGEDLVHDSFGFHSMGGASSDYSRSNCIYTFFSEYESDTGPEDVVNPAVKFNHPLECYYTLCALQWDFPTC